MNTKTDQEIQELLAHPSTQRQGFTYVVRQYSEQIYWQLRRMVHSHDDANDLVQNTFIKAWEAIDGFRGDSKVSTWLYRIALYEGLAFLQKLKREQEKLPNTEEASYLLERLMSDSYFDGDEYERIFQEAITTLPEKQRLVFQLRYYDELPYEQISSLTGTTQGALKASYHHAVKKITAWIEEHYQSIH